MTSTTIKNKIYLNILLGVLIFAIIYIIIIPQFSGGGSIYKPNKNISTLLKEKKDYTNAATLADSYIEKINKTNNEYLNTSANLDINSLNKVLPAEIDPIIIIYELTRLAARPESNMYLKSPQYTENSESNSSTRYNTFSINFSTEGTYDQLKAFLKNLELSQRIYNISSLSFTSSKDSKYSSSLKYSMSIETYYLK